MGLVIYRKSDNKVMMEVIQFPLHDTKIFQKFIDSGDFNPNDYAELAIGEDLIPQAFLKEIIVINGKITFSNDRNPIEPVPPTPTEVEELRAENAILQASVIELSAYTATQDERLQTQESAIMELSTLITGGI